MIDVLDDVLSYYITKVRVVEHESCERIDGAFDCDRELPGVAV